MRNGVLFDLDGTLADSLRDIAAAMDHALGELGLPTHSLEAYEHFIGDGARMLVRRAIGAAIDHEERALELFRARYGEHLVVHTRPYPGIEALLDELRDVPTAVLSNKPHEWTVAIVRALFPQHPFTIVLGHRAPALHKPDPSTALEIARALDRSPDRVLFVGDTAIDVETARRAGMIAIGASWGMRPEELGGAIRIDAPRELLAHA
jgi:phosphoglycolate phosphatase